MEIEVGKYTLMSDQWSMWIDEKYEYTNKKGERTTGVRRCAGYSPNLWLLMEDFAERSTRESGAREMREVLDELASTERAMMKFINTAYKKKFALEEKK